MKKIAIINGPNLNMLGIREPHIYGEETLEDIEKYTKFRLDKNSLKVQTQWFQSNIEGEIIENIHNICLKQEEYEALIINPAGYSHTSVAILDALKMLKIPIIEVHLSNVHAREDFRGQLLTAKAASMVLEGLGKQSYYMAIQILAD